MLGPPDLPSRDYPGKLAAPSRWYAFTPRAGDIVVSTPPKSGTTWVQGILVLLISGDPEVDAAVARIAPWIDIDTPEQDAILAAFDRQSQRRQLKTHTPFDGIPVWSGLRYISVYRHPIDMHFSFRSHVYNMRKEVLRDCFPANISEGFRIFLEGEHRDGASLTSIVDHYRSALARDARENFLRLHYADMVRDPAQAFRRIANHVGIFRPPELEAELLKAASFANMKANAGRFAVAARQGFWRNDADFFDNGTSNKWEGRLAPEDLATYDARISALLAPDERRWLEWGTIDAMADRAAAIPDSRFR